MGMLDTVKNYFSKISVTPLKWIIALSGILIVRFLLEAFSSPSSTGFIASDAPTLLHYYLFFVAIACIVMLVLRYFVPDWSSVIPVITLYMLLITIIPPVIDWLISGGHGFSMAYLFDAPPQMMHSFVTFFGPFHEHGITLGIRIELVCIIVGFGIFVCVLRRSVLRAVFAMAVMYSIAFVAISIPGIVNSIGNAGYGASNPMQYIGTVILDSSTTLNNIHGTLQYDSVQRMIEVGFDFLMGKLWFLLIFIEVIAWFLIYYKHETVLVLKNYRPERLFHFLGMVVVGMVVAYHIHPFGMNWNDWMSFIVLCVAVYCSWMTAVCVNDIYDTEIDAISNSSRPMIKDSLSETHMKTAGTLFFIMALVGGYLAGYCAFFFILAFNALYYIYSAPPLRLKCMPFVATGIIGLCSFSAFAAGFFTFSLEKYASAVPASAILIVIVFFSLLPHVRDIKDITGDRANGIWTVPTLFGPLWGPRVVGILTVCAYMLIPLVIHDGYILCGSCIASLCTYWLCVRTPYVERPIFIVYGLYAVLMAIALW